MLVDVFSYRVKLSNDQFFETGFSEQKMMLVLGIYDIIKKIKRTNKVDKTLAMKDTKMPHPCDLADKGYGLVDHKQGIAKELQFNINPTLLTSKITCKSHTKLPQFVS